VGTEQTGPSLPLNIDLESASPYVNADSIAVTSTTLDESAFREVTVHGIVRGQSRTVSLSDQQTVRETNLTLTATNANATHAVVRATVTETATGAAVTSGRVTAGNQTAALNSSGIATLTLSNPGRSYEGSTSHPSGGGQIVPTQRQRMSQRRRGTILISRRSSRSSS